MKYDLDLSRRVNASETTPKSLAGLSIPALKAEMEALGLDPKKAGMRAKQLRRVCGVCVVRVRRRRWVHRRSDAWPHRGRGAH